MSDLISRQAILDGIEELKKSPWATDTRGTGFEYLIAESLDTVRDLVVKQMPSTENKGEWIPVSERLPKIADVYRVTRYYPNNVMNPRYLVDACAFDGSNTWYNDNRINHERAYADNVIAWQENPEPYKPEKGGE